MPIPSHLVRRLITITSQVAAQGGTVYLVGGAVRDLLLKIPINDLDLEVHGLSLTRLKKILRSQGPASQVGLKFGIIKLATMPEVDWALPREDGKGRKPEVRISQALPLAKALERRDFTVNAMALPLASLLTTPMPSYEKLKELIIDPFHGKDDLTEKTLRAVNLEKFSQDPLRLFRAAHFMARFNLTPDKELTSLCSQMSLSTTKGEYNEISHERIREEFRKILLKGVAFSKALTWLYQVGKIAFLNPELAKLTEATLNKLGRSLDRTTHAPWGTIVTQPEQLAGLRLSLFSTVLSTSGFKEFLTSCSPNKKTRSYAQKLSETKIDHLANFRSNLEVKHATYLLSKRHISLVDILASVYARESFDPTKLFNQAKKLGTLFKSEPPRVTGKMLQASGYPQKEFPQLLEYCYLEQISNPGMDAKQLLKQLARHLNQTKI